MTRKKIIIICFSIIALLFIFKNRFLIQYLFNRTPYNCAQYKLGVNLKNSTILYSKREECGNLSGDLYELIILKTDEIIINELISQKKYKPMPITDKILSQLLKIFKHKKSSKYLYTDEGMNDYSLIIVDPTQRLIFLETNYM